MPKAHIFLTSDYFTSIFAEYGYIPASPGLLRAVAQMLGTGHLHLGLFAISPRRRGEGCPGEQETQGEKL
jgi:hypothetical protein